MIHRAVLHVVTFWACINATHFTSTSDNNMLIRMSQNPRLAVTVFLAGSAACVSAYQAWSSIKKLSGKVQALEDRDCDRKKEVAALSNQLMVLREKNQKFQDSEYQAFQDLGGVYTHIQEQLSCLDSINEKYKSLQVAMQCVDGLNELRQEMRDLADVLHGISGRLAVHDMINNQLSSSSVNQAKNTNVLGENCQALHRKSREQLKLIRKLKKKICNLELRERVPFYRLDESAGSDKTVRNRSGSLSESVKENSIVVPLNHKPSSII